MHVARLDQSQAILSRKTIAANAIRQVVDMASNIAGGAGFFHGHPLERIIRDVRAMHFHPLAEQKQTEMAGRVLLSLNPV